MSGAAPPTNLGFRTQIHSSTGSRGQVEPHITCCASLAAWQMTAGHAPPAQATRLKLNLFNPAPHHDQVIAAVCATTQLHAAPRRRPKMPVRGFLPNRQVLGKYLHRYTAAYLRIPESGAYHNRAARATATASHGAGALATLAVENLLISTPSTWSCPVSTYRRSTYGNLHSVGPAALEVCLHALPDPVQVLHQADAVSAR